LDFYGAADYVKKAGELKSKDFKKRSDLLTKAEKILVDGAKIIATVPPATRKSKKLTVDHLTAVIEDAKDKKGSHKLVESLQKTIKTLEIADPPEKNPHIEKALDLIRKWDRKSDDVKPLASAKAEIEKIDAFHDSKFEPVFDALEKADAEYKKALDVCDMMDDAPLKARLRKIGENIAGAKRGLKRK
jgi:hypothetical protein